MTVPPDAPAPASASVFIFEIPAVGAPVRSALAAMPAAAPGADPEQAARTWLQEREQTRLERFLVEPARAEFLAGRIAAKAALAALDPRLTPDRCEIVPGVWQQPTIRPESHGLAVTLTHGGGLALALAADDRWLCGIDLEPVVRAERHVIAPMVGTAERVWADAAPDAATRQARWAVLWTAREALGKMLRCGIARPGLLLPLTDIRETSGTWTARFDRAGDIAVHATLAGGFVVSCVAPALDGSEAPLRRAWAWLRTAVEQLGPFHTGP